MELRNGLGADFVSRMLTADTAPRSRTDVGVDGFKGNERVVETGVRRLVLTVLSIIGFLSPGRCQPMLPVLESVVLDPPPDVAVLWVNDPFRGVELAELGRELMSRNRSRSSSSLFPGSSEAVCGAVTEEVDLVARQGRLRGWLVPVPVELLSP